MSLEFSTTAPPTVKCCVFTFHYGAKFNVSRIVLREVQINTPWTLACMLKSAEENKSKSVINSPNVELILENHTRVVIAVIGLKRVIIFCRFFFTHRTICL